MMYYRIYNTQLFFISHLLIYSLQSCPVAGNITSDCVSQVAAEPPRFGVGRVRLPTFCPGGTFASLWLKFNQELVNVSFV